MSTAPDAHVTVLELGRASVALEKALGEAIRDAVATGHSWAEVGQALGVERKTPGGVREEYDVSRHSSWRQRLTAGLTRKGLRCSGN